MMAISEFKQLHENVKATIQLKKGKWYNEILNMLTPSHGAFPFSDWPWKLVEQVELGKKKN